MAGERLRNVLASYRRRYRKASRAERSRLLDEFCQLTGYHRKYAITLLNRRDESTGRRRCRGPTYSRKALQVIEAIWRAAGYPWSVRLKALIPQWLPWARKHIDGLTPEVEKEVLSISPRQIDRRLASKKRRLRRRIYGRTKPATLLRHEVPIRTHPREVNEPGYTEVDLVSHSGPSARGEFAYSLNLTDIYSGWCESRAVLGRGQEAVLAALKDIQASLPFPILAIHSDNGSEFINHHLIRYCQSHGIAMTRSRPYKKDDNARIEQKNWTHVRRIWGWGRYDRAEEVRAMNELYRGQLRLMMNLFQPSVKLIAKERRGSRLIRRYEGARTPLERLAEHYDPRGLPQAVKELVALRRTVDPFELSSTIDRKLRQIEAVRSARRAKKLESR